MRTIKFRVWCNTTKHFTDIPFYSCSGWRLLWHHTLDEITISNIDDGDYVIQQYTGLKDKNGKEVYEGDILLDDAKIPLECFYDNGKFMAGISYASQEWFSDCEVVGNIFENKDLLK